MRRRPVQPVGVEAFDRFGSIPVKPRGPVPDIQIACCQRVLQHAPTAMSLACGTEASGIHVACRLLLRRGGAGDSARGRRRDGRGWHCFMAHRAMTGRSGNLATFIRKSAGWMICMPQKFWKRKQMKIVSRHGLCHNSPETIRTGAIEIQDFCHGDSSPLFHACRRLTSATSMPRRPQATSLAILPHKLRQRDFHPRHRPRPMPRPEHLPVAGMAAHKERALHGCHGIPLPLWRQLSDRQLLNPPGLAGRNRKEVPPAEDQRSLIYQRRGFWQPVSRDG